MRLFLENGLNYCNGLHLAIDPTGKNAAKNAVITHAHSDHFFASGAEKNYFLSKQTLALAGERLSSGKKNALGFKQELELEGVKIRLHSSGHILGAAQVEIEAEKKVVVTSDFKLQDSILFKGAEVLKSDVLVIESTFGQPYYSFPEREKLYGEISSWARKRIAEKKLVVFGGHAVGKAQELTRIASEYCGQLPIVHEKIFQYNKVYEEQGVKLGGYEKLNHNLKQASILIMPQTLLNQELLQAISLSSGKKVSAAIATGQPFWNPCFEKCFPLSDHADFEQLLHYVQESEPKTVYTQHGFAREFARHLRRKGFNALELKEKGQKSIQEFL